MVSYLVVLSYFLVLTCLSVFGAHRYYLVYLFRRNRGREAVMPPMPDELPEVTVQLPVYNEKYVVERLVRAVVALDYPRQKLSVQILDDSTDETTDICRRLCEELSAAGHNIELVRRPDRVGFKAGALDYGQARAKGSLIAVFDADFIPSPSFLRDTVPFFSEASVGMVQTRWGYVNEDFSLLTKLQTLFLDGHFVVEHAARCWSKRFFNFNGTAGVWRKTAITDAGGWQHDTITEDLDLSYRAQMRGWQFVYRVGTVCSSELPVEMNALKTQQHRWAKGSIETARKLLPRILRSQLPVRVKAEAVFHLCGNAAYLLVLLLVALTFPALLVRVRMGWAHVAWLDAVFFLVALLPVCIFYVYGQKAAGKPWRRRLMLLPAMLGFGIGISVNNGRAVLEGLIGRRSDFVRTPKYRVEKRGDRWMGKGYRVLGERGTLVELFLALYCVLPVLFALRHHVYASIPFLLLFVFGFGYMASLSFCQSFSRRHSAPA